MSDYKNTENATELKCRNCDKVSKIEDFAKIHIIKSGHQRICKECERERVRQYYFKNRDKILKDKKSKYISKKKKNEKVEDTN
jgi:superfamily II helicase